MDLVLRPGEEVLKVGSAHHIYGLTSVRAVLWLTNQRLVIRSSRLLQPTEDSLALGDILGAEPVKTLGLLSNRVFVALKDGRGEEFVVADQGDWLRKIAAARQAMGTAAPPPPQVPGRPPAVATYQDPLMPLVKVVAAVVGVGFVLFGALFCCAWLLIVMGSAAAQ